MIRRVYSVVLMCFALFMNRAYSSVWPTYESLSKMGCYQKAAVSTDSAPCTPVGVDILKQNGSAVDAAIAMLICIGANNPHSSGLGGGFFMVYYNRTEKRSYFIDSREVAPAESDENTTSTGPKSIAVPAELAGCEKAHSLFGRLPWKELFTATIKMCQEGILVSKHLENAITVRNLSKDEEIGKLFLKDGIRGYKAGERIKMTKLARTLEIISQIGKRAIYGPSVMAEQFLADLKAAGSPIAEEDMKHYEPLERKPVKTKLKNEITLHSGPFPGSGALLAMMLNTLEGYSDLSKNVTKDDDLATKLIHRILEIVKLGEVHKLLIEDGDSNEAEKLIAKLTSKAYSDELRSKINDFATHRDRQFSNLEDAGHQSTAHVSVVSPDGDAVSVTSSINEYFGSLIMSSSTGIILNNEMGDFSSVNSSQKNLVRSGKRPRSSMAPAIFTDSEGNVKLVIGAEGGLKITSTIFQIAARVLYIGESIKRGIDAPRLHATYKGSVEFEPDFPKEMVERVTELGHARQNWSGISIAIGVARTKDGQLCANSDFRKGGEMDGLN